MVVMAYNSGSYFHLWSENLSFPLIEGSGLNHYVFERIILKERIIKGQGHSYEKRDER